MIGVVVDIVVGGEVVRTESSNANLLTKVLKERKKSENAAKTAKR